MVTWAAASGGGSVDPATSTTDANGHAQTFRTLGILLGTQTTTATATVAGKDTTVTFSSTATAAGASQMTRAGGDGQTGTVGTTLPTQVSVRVTDQFHNPVAGVTVTWTPATGSGSVNPTTSASNSSGIATTTWTLGTAAGTQTVQATGAGSPVSFSATATAGAATQLTISTPPSATAQSGVAFAQQPVVQLREARESAVKGEGVDLGGGRTTKKGTLGGTLTATTNGSGVASFTNLAIAGAAGDRTLSFSATGLAAATSGTITITAGAATQLSITTQPSTSAQSGVAFAQQPVVQLRDASGNPVSQAGGTVTAATAPPWRWHRGCRLT